eukprot:10120125-Alexandrium_andersonii.AAC.1
MSASLVGSEMCIRDRRARARARPTARCLRQVVQHGVPGMRAVQGPSPVSYTHLTLPTICSV